MVKLRNEQRSPASQSLCWPTHPAQPPPLQYHGHAISSFIPVNNHNSHDRGRSLVRRLILSLYPSIVLSPEDLFSYWKCLVKSWHANVHGTQLNVPLRPLWHLQHRTRRHAITDPWGNLKESQLLWSVDCYRRLEIGQCCFSVTVRLVKRLLSVGVWPHMYDEYVGYRWLFFAATVSGWITERILWATALQRWLETSCCMLLKGTIYPMLVKEMLPGFDVGSQPFCKPQILPRSTFISNVVHHVYIICLLATMVDILKDNWGCF